MTQSLRIILPVAATLALAGCNRDTASATPDESSAAQTEDGTEASAEPMQDKTVVDIAVEAGNFKTLVTALKAAGLVEALSGEGPFTVFAPTDDAFAKLPPGALDALLADPDQLKAVLTYHVVPGKVMAADVAGLTEATALSGKMLAIDTSAGVKVGGAMVVTTDIPASNGVIHVIDTVIIPAP